MRDRIRLCAVALFFGTSFGGMLWFAVMSTEQTLPFSDFIVFWTAARVPVAQVYDAAALTEAQRWYFDPVALRPFAYPPSLLPILAPFGRLPFIGAGLLWVALGLGVLIAASRGLAPLRVAALALIARPVVEAAFAGQTTLLVGGLIVGAFSILARRPLLAGVLIGIAATIKPQAVLLAPLVLAVGGQWRALFGATATGAMVGLVCLAIQGASLWADWLAGFPAFAAALEAGDIARLGITPASIWPPLLAPGIVLGLAVAVVCARGRPHVQLAGMVIGSILCSPYALGYDLAPLAPALLMLLLDRDEHPAVWPLSAIVLSGLAGPWGVILCAGLLIAVQRRVFARKVSTKAV